MARDLRYRATIGNRHVSPLFLHSLRLLSPSPSPLPHYVLLQRLYVCIQRRRKHLHQLRQIRPVEEHRRWRGVHALLLLLGVHRHHRHHLVRFLCQAHIILRLNGVLTHPHHVRLRRLLALDLAGDAFLTSRLTKNGIVIDLTSGKRHVLTRSRRPSHSSSRPTAV